jgi:hypothetical protein
MLGCFRPQERRPRHIPGDRRQLFTRPTDVVHQSASTTQHCRTTTHDSQAPAGPCQRRAILVTEYNQTESMATSARGHRHERHELQRRSRPCGTSSTRNSTASTNLWSR